MYLLIQYHHKVYNLLEVAKSCSIDEVNACVDNEQGIVCDFSLSFLNV